MEPNASEHPPTPRNGRPRRKEARELVAVALAGGATVAAAAAGANVGPKTVRTWLKDPGFVSRVDAFRSEAVAAALGKLTDGMADAGQVLRDLLRSNDEDVKHKAAVKIIELGSKLRTDVALADRLAALEAAMRSTDADAGNAAASTGADGVGPQGGEGAGPTPSGPDGGNDDGGATA